MTIGDLTVGVEAAILAYFLALNSFYAVLLVLSIPEMWEQARLAGDEDFQRLMRSDALPPITILVPAYNERETIEASVTAILTLEYRHYEVIVVNDGSRDDTMDQLRHAFDLYEVPRDYPEQLATRPLRGLYRSRSRSRLLVLDKENGGKADSLNAAINASRYPYVIAVDADTLIEPDALLRLTRPFLLGREIAAVGGTVRVANSCTVQDGRVTDARVPTRLLPGIQVVEYLRAFLFGRLGWNRLGGNLIISGAFGLFRKKHLLGIGGYRADSIVEDLDLVMRLHRHLKREKIRYEMPFIPDPVAWTEVPESMQVLGRQRSRWHRGLIAAMWTYRGMLLNPRYGRIGCIAMPFYALGEMLAPAIEVFGYVVTILGLAFGLLNLPFALLFVVVAWGYGMLLSVWAVVLEEASFRRYRRWRDLIRLLLFATLENFGYRQCTVWWRLTAFASVWRRVPVWGEMARKGFGSGRSRVATILGLSLAATPAAALGQTVRVAASGSYHNVTDSDDWSLLAGRLAVTQGGHNAWVTVERQGRFGRTDNAAKLGGVIRAAPRWWIAAEAGVADRPVFLPRNTWEIDVTALVAARFSLGAGYRHWNFPEGPVDVVIPHASLQTRNTAWDARVYLSRTPARRTDAAFFVRATRALSARAAGWILAGAGRESFLVPGPTSSAVSSFATTTGEAGVRWNAGNGFSLRLDASVISSRPRLSRRGIGVAVEREL